MSEFGVTDKGFVLKRMDTVMEEIHGKLTAGFGFDTRTGGTSFLNTLITTFSGQIAELWETAQDSYYAKFPSTANGVNLDNSVQYGGIKRAPGTPTRYMLHCTGDDGTQVREKVIVATNTKPEIRLTSAREFSISRNNCNEIQICVAAVEEETPYFVIINGEKYNYYNSNGGIEEIINGLASLIDGEEYIASVTEENSRLTIKDTVKWRNDEVMLSDNLTTSYVTSVTDFLTVDIGKIVIPYGVATKIINNIPGFHKVKNLVDPVYGRLPESDVELKQSYIAKSALRSTTMIDSIAAELLNNVENIETVCGYENYTDFTDERGLPPHSIEIVVEGGEDARIADAILRKKAGGIQTYGKVRVDVLTNYGDMLPIKFNRPDYIYGWIKVVLHGNNASIPKNYESEVTDSILEYCSQLVSGDSLYIQKLNDGIYKRVPGVTFIDIFTASSFDNGQIPQDENFSPSNIKAETRNKILISGERIEVSVVGDS